jgi:uncharacterized protein
MLTKDKLKEIVILQKENLKKLEKGTIREIKVEIDDSFAVILTGIRRSGKSTLLNQILSKEKKSYYLNLEDPRLENFDLSDFNKIEIIMQELYGTKGIYFFDEIQNIQQWEKFIRYLVDKKEKVVITGSNASILSKELGTKLTGRYFQKEIFPFSFNEFLSYKNKKPSIKMFNEYFLKGGFPEYIKKENNEILNNLLTDIVLKDVVIRYNIKNNAIVNKIALYLISNVSKEFTYNSIKKLFQIKSIQSVIDYIKFLEDTYLIFSIPCFDYSYKKQQVNPKKIYSIDNGISIVNSTSFSKDKGRMLENITFLHLRKKYKNIFYYKNEHECDFLIKEKESITKAFQVCYELNDNNKEREINGLMEALIKFKIDEGIIVTYNQEDSFFINKKTIKLIPCYKWLLD